MFYFTNKYSYYRYVFSRSNVSLFSNMFCYYAFPSLDSTFVGFIPSTGSQNSRTYENDDVAAPPLAHVTTATYLWLIDGSLAR
jgi:hypothetical protein